MKSKNLPITIFLMGLAILFVAPVIIVLINSFKGQFYILDAPFKLPDSSTFFGINNYISGIEKTNFLSAFGYSLFITVFSVLAIIFFPAMTSWYIARVKNAFTKILYYGFILSMVIPFQMVMFTMAKTANVLSLDNPLGIIFIYLGFGSGLSIFMYTGFVKSIPKEIEEAAMIDGCNPVKMFFSIIFPILKPIAITIAILNAMWIWNDYLLPLLLIGNDYKTIPIAVQYLRGGYGSVDMGAMMALLVLSIIPIIVFYLISQKYIIEGVVSGAVKG
ncbi:MAG: carbohydrate ABC transporter permease [Ruminococcaceae bacterium]|nr:carbohydrate ABC transporter permease [Oscillospiraceae bacterium]